MIIWIFQNIAHQYTSFLDKYKSREELLKKLDKT